MPLPAGGAREVNSRFGRHLANGRDAVAPLPEARDDAERRHKQLGWHAVPTLPRYRANPTKLERETFAAGAAGLGVRIGKLKAAADHLIGIIEDGAAEVEGGLGVDEDLNRLGVDEDIAGLEGTDEAEFIRQPIAAATGDSHAEVTALGLTGCQGLDLGPSGWRQLD